jgi:hypothetical protein
MDTSSFFIDNKAMFGSYPSQPTVDILEKRGVKFFINLTYEHEKNITPYSTKYNYISFPIPDGGIPTNRNKFTTFIYKLCDIINNLDAGELIYIHCKGGHGRCGVVVSCITSKIFEIPPYKALSYTTKCHMSRKTMREKWRILGSPQTHTQKQFVFNMCSTTVISKQHALHPDYELEITHPTAGEFKTATDAINFLLKDDTLGLQTIVDIVTNLKLEQHPFLNQLLSDTCLRYLIFQTPPTQLTNSINTLSHIRFQNYLKMF